MAIFALPLLFEVMYMLFSLQFIALLSRLLNVRQTKRLSGLTRSGEFLAEMVGAYLSFSYCALWRCKTAGRRTSCPRCRFSGSANRKFSYVI